MEVAAGGAHQGLEATEAGQEEVELEELEGVEVLGLKARSGGEVAVVAVSSLPTVPSQAQVLPVSLLSDGAKEVDGIEVEQLWHRCGGDRAGDSRDPRQIWGQEEGGEEVVVGGGVWRGAYRESAGFGCDTGSRGSPFCV